MIKVPPLFGCHRQGAVSHRDLLLLSPPNCITIVGHYPPISLVSVKIIFTILMISMIKVPPIFGCHRQVVVSRQGLLLRSPPSSAAQNIKPPSPSYLRP